LNPHFANAPKMHGAEQLPTESFAEQALNKQGRRNSVSAVL